MNDCLALGLSISLALSALPVCHAQPDSLPGEATPVLVIPRLVSSLAVPPRDVLSLREIHEYRSALAPRLIADHMDFPLMVRPSDPVLKEQLGAPGCAYFGNDFAVRITRPWCDPEAWPVFDRLKAELSRQGVDRSRAENELEIELCTFLVNGDVLRQIVRLCAGASESGREFMFARLDELERLGRLILRFKEASLNGMRRLEEIDKLALPAKTRAAPHEFERLVAASEGMRESDTRKLLDVFDETDFQRLSLQRTAELLGRELSEQEVRERLSKMPPSEAITAAAFFARSRFQAYADPEMQMESFSPEGGDRDDVQSWLQVGDCKHFAGLAVHYLNHVVKPLNPALAEWYFGVQTTHIRDYHHAYVKAVHLSSDGTALDVFFFDPTRLANHPLRRLTPSRVRKIIEATDRDDHFFVLKRYAEDLVRSPLDPDAAFGDQEILLDTGHGNVDVQSLLRQ